MPIRPCSRSDRPHDPAAGLELRGAAAAARGWASRRLAAALAWAAALSQLGCGRPLERIELRAPEVLAAGSVQAEPGLPWTLFDRRASSLVAGDGWSQTQRDPSADGVDRYSLIALGDLSKLHFLWPGGDALDLYLRCRPTRSDPAEPRTRLRATPEAGGTTSAELAPGWNDLRLPLASTLRPGALLTVELRFGAERAAAGESPSDRARRAQWAYCSAAALLPRDSRPPLEALAALHDVDLTVDDPEPARTPPRTRTLGIPVPGRVRARLELDPAALPADCELSARLAGNAVPESPAIAAPAARGLDFAHAHPAPAELRLELGGAGRPECTLPIDGSPIGELLILERDGRPTAPTRPHIFVYLIDTLRADALESPHRGLLAAPRLLAFARDAVRFDSAWAASSWTLPSILSLVTGVHPHRNGIWRLDQALPRDGARTLPEILTAGGYATVGFSQTWIAGPLYGFDRGFRDYFVSEQINGTELRTNDLHALFRAWLVGRWTGAEPIFAYLHSVEPHGPYAPRAEDVARFGGVDAAGRVAPPLQMQTLRDIGKVLSEAEMGDVLTLYHAEVAYADQAFGRFLDLLRSTGLYEDSIVVLLSDHGEEFREHGGFGHGRNLYEESTRVPLLVRFPHGRWAGRRVATGVSLTDLMPTLLDYLHLEVDPGLALDGSSILPLLAGADRGRRLQISEVVTKREGPESEAKLYRSLRLAGARCVHVTPHEPQPGGEERWTFLRSDPASGQESPLAGESAAARVCQETLQRFEKSVQSGRRQSTTFQLTDDQLEALRSLGYL